MNDHGVAEAVSAFGKAAGARLSSATASGEPEDQLRGPFENLIQQLAQSCGFKPGSVVTVGESSISELKTRPDYAVTVGGTLVGFIELKAPGKSGDLRRFNSDHDKAQWQRLQSLPNLIYSDGNEFSLWRSSELATAVVRLEGDVETSGAALGAGSGLLPLFCSGSPSRRRSAKELAEITARLCRLLRDEVIEALERKTESLTTLAQDWRGLLFPQASDEQFADGYAQAVTFSLLMARRRWPLSRLHRGHSRPNCSMC